MIFAGVMELADVLDSKSSGSDTVPVRPRSPAPIFTNAISGCSAVGSAPALGAGCREFEPLHSDHKKSNAFGYYSFYFCIEYVLILDFLNTNRRLPALGYEHDRLLWRKQGVIGAPEKRKLLRGPEPQRSYELFE